jgi:hypothetical protein
MTLKQLVFAGLIALLPAAQARTVGIFSGAGTCDGCAATVGQFFLQRHDEVIYLNERTLNARTLAHIQVYVQPGGSDDIDETLDALSPSQIKALREFVHDGGSYFGDMRWCLFGWALQRQTSQKISFFIDWH